MKITNNYTDNFAGISKINFPWFKIHCQNSVKKAIYIFIMISRDVSKGIFV